MNEINKLGILDIGSNAIRWMILQGREEGGYEVIRTHRDAIRLGADVFMSEDKVISEGKIFNLTKACENFISACASHHAKPVAVATSALRNAKNRKEVVKTVKDKTGLKIDVIDGSEEARYVFLAVRQKVELANKAYLLMDIGGGSVEFSLSVDGDVVWSTSVPGGGIRFLQLFTDVQHLRFSDPEYCKRLKFLDRIVNQHAKLLIDEMRVCYQGRIDGLIGTGGNFECMEELCDFLFGERSGIISYAKFDDYYKAIKLTSRDELITRYEVREDRADVLLAATILVDKVLRFLSIPQIIVPEVGLRDGVGLAHLPSVRQKTEEINRSPVKLPDVCHSIGLQVEKSQVIYSAINLGRRFNFNESHGIQVQKLAAEIFKGLEFQGPSDLLAILECASVLHDIGRVISPKKHHKHSYYLIQHSPIFGLNSDQKDCVATIARFHRKKFPEPGDDSIRELSPCYRPFIPFLSAILRLADALDREHLSKVERVEISKSDKGYQLTAFSNLDCEIELWSLQDKKRLFESVFQADMRVVVKSS